MDTSRILRLAAAGFVVLAIAASALQLRRLPSAARPAPAPIATAPARPADLLAAELLHCQGLGEAGAHDASCLAAWAECRRRFLGAAPAPVGE